MGTLSFNYCGICFDIAASQKVLEYIDSYVYTDDLETKKSYSIKVFESQFLYDIVSDKLTSSNETRLVQQKPNYSYHFLEEEQSRTYLSVENENHPNHVIFIKNSSIEIYLTSETDNSIRVPLRVLRSVILEEFHNEKRIMLHAAAFKHKSIGGTLIPGDSGAGKTTTITKMINDGHSYISNDRTFLWREGKHLYVSGWPLSIRIGLGTARNFWPTESMRNLSRAENINTLKILAEHPDQVSKFGSKVKFELTPKELVSLLDCKVVNYSKLESIRIPSFSNGDFLRTNWFENTKQSPEIEDFIPGWLGIQNTSNIELEEEAGKIAALLDLLPIAENSNGY